MSIKQSITALLLFIGVSFNAFAEQLYRVGPAQYYVVKCIASGQVTTVDYFLGCSFHHQAHPTNVLTADKAYYSSNGYIYLGAYDPRFGQYTEVKAVRATPVSSCPNGQVLVGGTCQEPPKYCDLPSTILEIETARNSCESGGGTFTYTCSNETESWEPMCEAPPERSCADVEGERGELRWMSSVWGESVPSQYLCSSKGEGCIAAITQDTSLCFNESGWCYGDYIVIGPSCEVPSGPAFCTDANCHSFKPEPSNPPTDPEIPDHKPDDPTGGDIEDPSVLPDSDSDIILPDKPDDKPDVEDPEITPETDKAVVDAVKGMNSDINDSLHALNKDVNDRSAELQNQLNVLNGSLVTNTQAIQKQQINDNEIYRKTKSLIQQANADITTAVNRNTGAVNSLGEELGGLSGTLTGIGEDIEGISETLDGIANTDTTGAGWGGTCIADDSCTGFYDSGYPDGIEGVVNGHMNSIKDTVLDGFVNTFGELDLSNAKAPSFCLNVWQFGEFCFTDYMDFDWLFGFVRFCMIFTAIAHTRKIIFGG